MLYLSVTSRASRRLQAADALKTPEGRSLHARFGDLPGPAEAAPGPLLVAALSHALTALAALWLATTPQLLRPARQPAGCYVALSFLLDATLRFQAAPRVPLADARAWQAALGPLSLSLVPGVGGLLPFQKVQLLRLLFPCVACLALCWAALRGAPFPEQCRYLLEGALVTNKLIADRTDSVLAKLGASSGLRHPTAPPTDRCCASQPLSYRSLQRRAAGGACRACARRAAAGCRG